MSEKIKNDRMPAKVYLGLDMGVASVGWAVTDEKYNLIRKKGKDLWGVHLFSEAESSAERRSYRVNRRRRQREKNRLRLLRMYFADEINRIDRGFFMRLDESKLLLEDRSDFNRQKFSLFAGTDYTDKEYYEDYPTIFHLRKELLESDKPHDVRLVYLALLNMFKHRGHFLNSSLDDNNSGVNMEALIKNLIEQLEKYKHLNLKEQLEKCEHPDPKSDFNAAGFEAILGAKGMSRTAVLDRLAEYMSVTKKNKGDYEILKLICGIKGKLQPIYGIEIVDEDHKAMSLSFRDASYEETSNEIQEYLGDECFELILVLKQIHDTGMLSGIMKGHRHLTNARVESYEEHKKDLALLKKVISEQLPEAYDQMFRIMEAGNYSAYVGSVNSDKSKIRRNCQEGKGRSRDDLYATILKLIEKLPESDEINTIKTRIENETFLTKQLTSSNGVIPNQVYAKEMKQILANAEKYLPFLREKNDNGLTVSEQILQLFSFTIPYYVGPLGKEYSGVAGYNVWAIHKDTVGPIYPWDLENKIDIKGTAEQFIKRMVRHCTYMSDYHTLPKCSLMYEKFMALNELNNLKVHGEDITVEIKQDIYEKLFMKGKKVTVKKLEEYFVFNGMADKDDKDFISGIDVTGGFKASLSSVGKFEGIFGTDFSKDSSCSHMIEDIVFWMTVYGEDKKFVKERIVKEYPKITVAQLKKILGFKISGWGNLSREFLMLEGVSKEDGVQRTLIAALWETNDNLMQLLSDKYTYAEELEKITENDAKSLSEFTIEDLDDMYLSAPVKRMVWRSLRIINEVQQIIGETPDKVFVEMTRHDGVKGERKASRKRQLENIYKGLGKEYKNWVNDISGRNEADFRIKKLYLYYMQMGRCMYTGEQIDLDQLMNDNQLYDIDHIYPRHFVKDDSMQNNLVLVKKENNAHKSDNYPIEKNIQEKMLSYWKTLVHAKLITETKYNRLIRKTEFTDEEKAGFINRQLVETGQGTRAITQILKGALPDTEIVFSKAGVVSDFRKTFDIEKVRCINPLHHAQDAYLNIVAGNTYNVKFTKNPLRFIKAAEKSNSAEDKYHMDKIFFKSVSRNGEQAWIHETGNMDNSINTVRKVMRKNTPLITKRAYIAHGGITEKDTVYSKATAGKGSGYLPMITSDIRLSDVSKYGGRTSIGNMCYTLVEYSLSGKMQRSLEALPRYMGDIDSLPDETIVKYVTESLVKENPKKFVEKVSIRKRCIKYNSLLRIDGAYYYLAGKSLEQIILQNAMLLYLDYEWSRYIKKIEKALGNQYFGERDCGEVIITKKKNGDIFDIMIDKLSRGVLCKRKNNIVDTLKNSIDKFKNITIEEQCYVIMQIVSWMQIEQTKADLKHIGGAANAGKCLTAKKINSSYEFKLISKSVTGLYENQIDLLTI